MSPQQRAAGRALVLWLAAALATAGASLLARSTARSAWHAGRAVRFDQLLVALSAAALAASCAALTLSATGVLRDLRAGRDPAGGGPLRRLVLTACGVAVLAAASPAAAHAAAPARPTGPTGLTGLTALTGLPLPDRASGGPAAAPTADPKPPSGPHEHAGTVRVHPGDSLWSIAAAHVGTGAGQAAVAAYADRLYAANASTIGPDPDRILPGQTLHLPFDR